MILLFQQSSYIHTLLTSLNSQRFSTMFYSQKKNILIFIPTFLYLVPVKPPDGRRLAIDFIVKYTNCLELIKIKHVLTSETVIFLVNENQKGLQESFS